MYASVGRLVVGAHADECIEVRLCQRVARKIVKVGGVDGDRNDEQVGHD